MEGAAVNVEGSRVASTGGTAAVNAGGVASRVAGGVAALDRVDRKVEEVVEEVSMFGKGLHFYHQSFLVR